MMDGRGIIIGTAARVRKNTGAPGCVSELGGFKANLPGINA